jgi:hypothetical protein
VRRLSWPRRGAAVVLGALACALGAGAQATALAPGEVRVACLTGHAYAGRARPGACVILQPGRGDAGYWALRELRWRGWGRVPALAVGVAQGRPPEPGDARRLRVRLSLSGLRRGCDGRLWYSRARIDVRGGSVLSRLPTCRRRAAGP